LENASIGPTADHNQSVDAADSNTDAVIRAIKSRKSVPPKHLKDPGPTEAEIHFMVQAALAAPDHGNLRPWHAILIPQSRRAELAEIFRAAKLEIYPDASHDDLENAGAKAFNAPALLVILFDPIRGHAKITVEDQIIGLGAALQNLILAAHSFGYGAIITSGEKLRALALQSSFTGSATERAVAFVSIGTPVRKSVARTSAETARHLFVWRNMAERRRPLEK
jgi:nitroreductase